MMKIAVFFVNYGPYHIARGIALTRRSNGAASFIEIAASQKTYAWDTAHSRASLAIDTLSPEVYEETSRWANISRSIRALRKLKPTAVAIPGYHELLWIAIAVYNRLRGGRNILMFDSTSADRPRKRLMELVKRILIGSLFDAAFVAGSASKEYLKALGMPEQSIWLGYDVVDNDFFAAPPHDERGPRNPDAQGFVCINRLVPEKNVLALIDGYAAYLETSSSRLKLTIVGDGPLRGAVTERIQHLGLEALIELRGNVQIDEVRDLLHSSRALILYSLSEPWGLVVNEAMAAGLPVVVSGLAGAAHDLVEHGVNGYVVSPYQTSELASALLELEALTPAQWSAFSARSRQIVGHYSLDHWADTLIHASQGTRQTDPRLDPSLG